MKEITLDELDLPFRATLEKAQRATAERYFHYARSLTLSLLEHYPNCPALRLMLRQTALVTKTQDGSLPWAWTKTLLINLYHSIRLSPLKHINRLERVLLIRPDCLMAHRSLAHVAISKQLWGTAALSLEAVATLQPGDTHSQVLLSRMYLRLGRVADAQMVVRNILEREPQHDVATEMMREASVEETLKKDAWQNKA